MIKLYTHMFSLRKLVVIDRVKIQGLAPVLIIAHSEVRIGELSSAGHLSGQTTTSEHKDCSQLIDFPDS
jgi:hypothetical protein